MRQGPNHEWYVDQGTKHQTFVQTAYVRGNEYDNRAGVAAVAGMLRALADQIELHASKDAFITDPEMAWGDKPYAPPEPIKTQLVNMELSGCIDSPPNHQFDTVWAMRTRLTLQFQ